MNKDKLNPEENEDDEQECYSCDACNKMVGEDELNEVTYKDGQFDTRAYICDECYEEFQQNGPESLF